MTEKSFFFAKISSDIHNNILVCLFLVMVTLLAYYQVRDYDFINYDDNIYVTENIHVQSGLTLESIKWAFTTTYANFWHPLTWLSIMIDIQLFGMDPGYLHIINVFLHIASTLILFFILRMMTQQLYASCFVAVLFALHPLHVESVAWVSERKDVLSTLFWMMTMWSYIRYTKYPSLVRYLQTVLFFVCGLMAKPMLVTLPCVMFLIDYWPLERFKPCNIKNNDKTVKIKSLTFLILEKIPFFIFAIIFCAIAILAQQSGKIPAESYKYPLDMRILNALVSYVCYILKTVWPHNLAVFYPHPGMRPAWQAIGAALIIISISAVTIFNIKRRPYLIVGWLWYIGTLVPVIGLVQFGGFAIADRFTYVPIIGIFIIFAWSINELMQKWRYKKVWLAATLIIVTSVLLVSTRFQLQHWQNNITLFTHALSATQNNYPAHNNLGLAMQAQGNDIKAIHHFNETLRLFPNYARAHNSLGTSLAKQNRLDEAIYHYQRAIQIDPAYDKAYSNLGNALSKQGRTDDAITYYLKAIQINPLNSKTHSNFGALLMNKGEIDWAIAHFTKALQINPNSVEAHNNIGSALIHKERIDDAIVHYNEALRIQPDLIQTIFNLARAYSIKNEYAKAITLYKKILNINPDIKNVYYNIACIYAKQNLENKSIYWLEKAINKGYNKWELIKTDKDLEAIRGSSYYQKLIKNR